jgi:aminoglycoside phosphotransferase (APT) family kinase protein
VPVLPELADPECARHGISASPVWGDGDLSGSDNDPAAYRAGKALAAIHGVDPGTNADTADDFDNLVRQLTATRNMVCALVPELQEPATRLTRLLLRQMSQTEWRPRPVLAHGDFSPDQILVQGSAVRIIDFDRIRTADPASDLGSFAATEEIADHGHAGPAGVRRKTGHLIEGYRRAGGQVSLAAVDTWAAFRLFTGSVDPFRDRADNWPADTSWHIHRALDLTT